MPKVLHLFRLTLAIVLTVCTVLFVVWSRHWPLLGDASIIHYLSFLIEHGMAPYRDIHEMSFPGTFLIEIAGMHVFGPDALAWRIFDFALLIVAAVSFRLVTSRAGWFPAIFAATLLALVHGRDGLPQGGQRDLTMAVLLVAATAAITLAVRYRSIAAWTSFGLLAGIVLTIKPTAIPLSVAQAIIAIYVLRKRGDTVLKPVATASLATLAFPAVALAFLIRENAVAAFWDNLRGLVAYYAGLGHKSLGFLLVHSISPLMPLVIMWLVVLVLIRPRLDWERVLLLSGVAFGLLSYVIQARGFPYYRYPLLAFLLPLMALDFTEALPFPNSHLVERKIAGALAIIALAVGGLFLGPQSALLIHRYRWWQTDLNSSLEQNLNRLGGPALSGHIQCVDSISGCMTTLYKMRLVQPTGIVMDFPLFGDDRVRVVQEARAEFREKIFEKPPSVLVISSALYVDGPGDYQKLARWPQFTDFLAANYTLDTDWHPTRLQRWWSREEFGPSYRIYVRK